MTRSTLAYALAALVAAVAIIYGLHEQPGIVDAFYHYNAAARIASGEGFTDPYLWTYVGMPESLPAPSHLYWQPGTSIIAAAGMFLFGTNYAAAQIGFTLCLWGAALVAYYLGRHYGNVSIAWLSGILTLFSAFYMRVWGQTDTFAPYAFVGSLALVSMGCGMERRNHSKRWWLLAGICAGLGHLIRSDGLLLLLVGWSCLFWLFDFFRKERPSILERITHAAIFTTAYAITMLPWFLRNLAAIGTILPTGGTQAAWFTEYNDLFNYPPQATPEQFFAQGWDAILQTKLAAVFGSNGALLNFIAIEANIVFAPFIVVALWRRRNSLFLRGVLIFTLGIHAAFALVFTYPGIRGGLFHGVAALVPWWSVLGLIGVHDSIDWIAKQRKQWNPQIAKPLFSIALTAIVIVLAFVIANPTPQQFPSLYRLLDDALPADARIMINDPAALYYYTKRSGVPIPNEPPSIIPEIARRYNIDYVVLERAGTPRPMQFDAPPLFLRRLDLSSELETIEIYVIELDKTR